MYVRTYVCMYVCMYVYIHIYIYICITPIHIVRVQAMHVSIYTYAHRNMHNATCMYDLSDPRRSQAQDVAVAEGLPAFSGRGEDTAGNPHRAQIYQFELFESFLLM